MKVIADLQLHSKYSRAVSDKMNIEEIYRWAQFKGIHLVATGDWTYPLWIREIKEKLQETGRGTLRLNDNIKKTVFPSLKRQSLSDADTEFLLASEISSIYSQGGRTRRVHNLLWVPTISSAEKIITELEKKGCKLGSDGRPIVGLTSKEVLEIVLSIDETSLLIPAHAWTPWFALFGSKSGFDSIEECFKDLSDHIYAIETGLSSDPSMNWRIKELDNRTIISFSDAHSGPKLGREATVFDLIELSYSAIREAITKKTVFSGLKRQSLSERNKISCTFEFYPEEGKYHYDGHRNCSIRQSPEQTRKRGVQCPVCGRPLTVGVEYRVEELAGRGPVVPIKKKDDCGVLWRYHPDKIHPPFTNIVPLLELISEAVGVGTSSKKVQGLYFKLIESVADEFTILLKSPLNEIAKHSQTRIAEAVKKARAGDIFIDPGFDGEFGKVKVWKDKEKDNVVDDSKEQLGLF